MSVLRFVQLHGRVILLLLVIMVTWQIRSVYRHQEIHDHIMKIKQTDIKDVPGTDISVTLNDRQGCVCHELAGGFGNVMFQLASTYSIARRSNLKVVLKCIWMDHFNKTFEIHGSFSTDWNLCKYAIPIAPKTCCSYDHKLVKLRSDKTYMLNSYLQSHIYFDNYREKIQELFTFKPDILKKAKSVLKLAIEELDINPPYTLIGVHIRRGDILKKINKDVGFKAVTPEYLKRAREYMDSKYHSGQVIYVICSNDIQWSKTHFGTHGNEFYSENNAANVDLAILSLTGHMILSSGTFSWWAGWFSRGTVVYWKDFATPGSQLLNGFSADKMDYFYPEWVGL